MKFGIFFDGELVREFDTEEEAIKNGRWEDVYPIVTTGEWLIHTGGKWCIDDELFIRYESIFGTVISPVMVRGINRPKAMGKILIDNEGVED